MISARASSIPLRMVSGYLPWTVSRWSFSGAPLLVCFESNSKNITHNNLQCLDYSNILRRILRIILINNQINWILEQLYYFKGLIITGTIVVLSITDRGTL